MSSENEHLYVVEGTYAAECRVQLFISHLPHDSQSLAASPFVYNLEFTKKNCTVSDSSITYTC